MDFSRSECIKLNTKGCCFLCLRVKDSKQIDDEIKESDQLQHLLQYLQIKTVKNSTGSWNDAIQVSLCNSCGKIIKRFSVLFQQLEKIQMEMGYFLDLIHQCISGSSKNPSLVQVYSKRMTSDPETLTQLAFVDNLRKIVANEALAKQMKVAQPCVTLHRTRIPEEGIKNKEIIKTENKDDTEEVEDTQDTFFNELFEAPESPSSPELPVPECNLKYEPVELSSFASTSILEHPEVKTSIATPAATPRERIEPKKSAVGKSNRKSSHEYIGRNSETGIYYCKKCPKTTPHSSVIYKHYRIEHLKLRYECDICNSLYTQKASLDFHKKTCRENIMKQIEKEMDPRFKFICHICGKRFDTKDKLTGHRIDVHDNINRHSCDLCDKKFTKLCNLKKHKDAIHFGKVFYCDICNVKCRYQDSLRKHKKTCPGIVKKTVEAKNQ